MPSMSSSHRRAAIREMLARDGFVDVAGLQKQLMRSEATIRRDLEYLQRAGYARRTHGGAISADGEREIPFTSKLGTMIEAKQRIAKQAVKLVRDGQAVGFTGGTTTLQVARELRPRKGLTVVTNAITVAGELAGADVRVIVTGGELRGQTYELVGPLSEPVASQIHLDLVFVGVDGLTVDGGLTTHNPIEARINRVLIERSSTVVVVTDHTKLGRITFAQIAPIERADVLITDSDADIQLLDDFRRAGIQVIAD